MTVGKIEYKNQKFSLSGVSPCQDDPVEILPLAMGPFVSELQVFSYKKKYLTGSPFLDKFQVQPGLWNKLKS